MRCGRGPRSAAARCGVVRDRLRRDGARLRGARARHAPDRAARSTADAAWVRIAFASFAVLLVPLGLALVARRFAVFPWRLGADQPVALRLDLPRAACYFAFALLRPQRAYATGPMLGFLAYDAVLIVPFLRHFETVDRRCGSTCRCTWRCWSTVRWFAPHTWRPPERAR